ncbi:ABC transporter permease [candidate division KSB1 bacterium]
MREHSLNKPPKTAKWLLIHIVRYHSKYSISGDLEEVYRDILQVNGKVKADHWYWRQVLFTIFKYINNSFYWGTVMLKNYIKIAFRNLLKQRSFSFINISGLSIGLACSLLIGLWVQNELTYDMFHDNSSNIYRVVEVQKYAGGDFPVAVTPGSIGPELNSKYPEILENARVIKFGTLVEYQDNSFFEIDMISADKSFFSIFDFPVIKGDPETFFNDPNSVLITEDISKKYFGNNDPIGKVLRFDNSYNVTVTGVINNKNSQSHIKFDFLTTIRQFESQLDNWERNWIYTYVLLDDNADIKTVNSKIVNTLIDNSNQTEADVYLQPLKDIYLKSDFTADYENLSNFQYVYIFSGIALLVLIIACINFMNLSTARYVNRAKEVGLRKVIGAVRPQLLRQFFSESILITLIAVTISILLINFALPYFNNISGKELSLDLFGNQYILIGLFSLTVFTGIIAGIYPALFLSSFQPVQVIKGTYISNKRGIFFRKAFVILQFSLSIFLIICAGVISNQLEYIQQKDLGYDKSNMIFTSLRGSATQSYSVLKEELMKLPGVQNIGSISNFPGNIMNSHPNFSWPGKDPESEILFHYSFVDHDFLKTFKMNMLNGRDFDPLIDLPESSVAIINEEAAKMMGFDEPVGATFTFSGTNVNIIGVVKNFNFKPVYTKIEPIILALSPPNASLTFIRTYPTFNQTVIESISEKWESIVPNQPFLYYHYDELLGESYASENKMGEISKYFSFFAIFIACLGLFGLVSFTSERKIKEICIRKVLGASTGKLAIKTVFEFLKLVFYANIIAWPVSYILSRNWLNNFAYHTDISPSIFILSGILALLITVITVGYQSIKAANTNPAESLRHE